LLLSAYIVHEWTYDRFYKNIDRLAYISYGYKSPNESEYKYSNLTPTAVAPTLKEEFPDVAYAVRLYEYGGESIVKTGEKIISEQKLLYADEDFFHVLPYECLEGSLDKALHAPYDIVLTATLAKKYFQHQSAVGQTLEIDGQPWRVTAVVADPPTNTRYNFHAVMSNKTLDRYREPVWHSANDITLALLKDEQRFQSVQEKINLLVNTMFKESTSSDLPPIRINIEKLANVHLYSEGGRGNITYIYIFAVLAISIVILACVNFANLILARSEERAKEIGVKKFLGVARRSIFIQFLCESLFMVSIATFIGVILARVLFPAFSQYIGVEMELKVWSNPLFYLVLLVFVLLISLLSGGWPAYVISALKPLMTLKGKITLTRKLTIGKALVILQFCISIFFIICTLAIVRQLHYLQTKDTGLSRSQIIVLDGSVLKDAERTALKNNLTLFSFVEGVTASYDTPVNVQGGYTINAFEGKGNDFGMSVSAIPVEKDFLAVFEIPIVAGSNLTDNDIARARDTTEAREYSFIINKLTAKSLGLQPSEAIGKTMELNGRVGKVKTVVDNFNFKSLKEEVTPIVVFPEYDYFGNIFVKINKDAHIVSAMTAIEGVWKKIKPTVAFESHFLDDDYTSLYKHEQQTARIMGLFSMITIGIACMGLFALSAYAAQQRIKEIGIRKVLGASVIKIVNLLTFDFIKLILVALIIIVPIAWWIMDTWLQGFVYHIALEWWVFALAGIITTTTAFLTVSWQAIRAASANPVDSLRDE